MTELLERQKLIDLEGVIERGLETFIEVGNALLQIRDERLYQRDYDTFEDYCRERWQMSRSRAHRLIDAATVAGNLLPIGNNPTHESQVRPLTKLEPEEQRAAWKLATAINPNPTAREVEEIAETITRAVNDAIRESEEHNRIVGNERRREKVPPPLDEMWIAFMHGLDVLSDQSKEFDPIRIAKGDDELTASLHVKRAEDVIGMLSSFINAMRQTYPMYSSNLRSFIRTSLRQEAAMIDSCIDNAKTLLNEHWSEMPVGRIWFYLHK